MSTTPKKDGNGAPPKGAPRTKGTQGERQGRGERNTHSKEEENGRTTKRRRRPRSTTSHKGSTTIPQKEQRKSSTTQQEKAAPHQEGSECNATAKAAPPKKERTQKEEGGPPLHFNLIYFSPIWFHVTEFHSSQVTQGGTAAPHPGGGGRQRHQTEGGGEKSTTHQGEGEPPLRCNVPCSTPSAVEFDSVQFSYTA